jgi:prevent-host-death family protein
MTKTPLLTWRAAMIKSVSVAEAKSRFSELVNRASYGRERFLIERRGKPVGAIVSAEDLAQLEERPVSIPPRGLLAAVGALADVEEFDAILSDILRQREGASDREVNLE